METYSDKYGTQPYLPTGLESQGIIRNVEAGKLPPNHGPLMDYVVEEARNRDPSALERMYFINMDMFMHATDVYAEELVTRVKAGRDVNIVLSDKYKSPDWMTAIVMQKAEKLLQQEEMSGIRRQSSLRERVKVYYLNESNKIFESDDDGNIPFVDNDTITFDDNVISGKKYRQHMEFLKALTSKWVASLDVESRRRLATKFGEDEQTKIEEKVYENFIKKYSFQSVVGVYPRHLPQPRLNKIFFGCKDFTGTRDEEGKPGIAVVTDWKVVDYGVAHNLGLETDAIYRAQHTKGISETQRNELIAYAEKYNLPQVEEASEYLKQFSQ